MPDRADWLYIGVMVVALVVVVAYLLRALGT